MKKLQKIAVLGSFPPLRGLSSYCLEFSLALADLTAVDFLSFKSLYPAFLYPGGDLEEDHSFPKTRHPNLSVKRRLAWYNPISWLIDGLCTKADLLHAQWWSLPLSLCYACVCGGFKLRRKPVIFTVHNTLPHEPSHMYMLCSRLLFKFGSHFIVHTSQNRRQMIKHFRIPEKQISLIPHGTLDFHIQPHMDRSVIRRDLGFNPKEKVILLFGAIRPYKGVDTALRAFAKTVERIPEARLLIAGKLWEKWTPYEKLIETLGISDRVRTVLEYIPSQEVHRYFGASDMVILPYHRFDSQSGVGAMAVSFRKPMIVTNVGGLPDLVQNPKSAVVPKDAVALSDALVESLSAPDRLSAMATQTQTIAEKLAWPAIAKNTLNVYEKVMDEKKFHTQ